MKLKLNLNLYKDKIKLLTLDLFIFLLKHKEKLLIDLLISLVVLLLIILMFNPFLKPLEKIFKFKVRQNLEKNLNLLWKMIFMKISKKLDLLKYQVITYTIKILYNLYTKEKMFNWILNKVLKDKLLKNLLLFLLN